jgi:predicted metalloprotease
MRTFRQAYRLLAASILLLLLLLGGSGLSNPSAALAETQPSLQADETSLFDITAQLDPRGRDLKPFTEQVAAHLNNWWGELAKRAYRYQGPTVQWVVSGHPATLCGQLGILNGPTYMRSLVPCQA